MAIFFNERNIFNELELNGQEVGDSTDNATNNTDYTDEGENTQVTDNPAEAPEDYTVPDEGEEQTQEEEDNNPPEEGTESGSEDPNDASTDYTNDEGAPEGEDEGESQEDEEDDYSDDTPSDDEIKQLEDELFSRYNDQQINIMNTTLKQNFINMYELLNNTIDRINEIPKEDRFLKIIAFVSDKLSEIRDMVNDYLITTYYTKSYVENQINYKRFYITIKQIDYIIEQIYPKKD